jgi:hypothetical protein
MRGRRISPAGGADVEAEKLLFVLQHLEASSSRHVRRLEQREVVFAVGGVAHHAVEEVALAAGLVLAGATARQAMALFYHRQMLGSLEAEAVEGARPYQAFEALGVDALARSLQEVYDGTVGAVLRASMTCPPAPWPSPLMAPRPKRMASQSTVK